MAPALSHSASPHRQTIPLSWASQPSLLKQCRGAWIKHLPACINVIRHFLAQLNAELIEWIDAQQYSVGKGAVLMKRNQSINSATASLIVVRLFVYL